jgi:hypothetical protein
MNKRWTYDKARANHVAREMRTTQCFVGETDARVYTEPDDGSQVFPMRSADLVSKLMPSTDSFC